MGLSDSEEKKWDEAALKGILSNDSTLNSVMSGFRNAMYSAFSKTGTGSNFAIYNLGITTGDYSTHGKLTIDEEKFDAVFEQNFDQIVDLFTNTEHGIMKLLQDELDKTVSTSGKREQKGVLVGLAGANTSSRDNYIYDQIENLNKTIASLELRYESQQNRYWKIYTNLEVQMGKLNEQTSSLSSLGLQTS
jgi:flagellar hook-associated protein 2